MSESLTIDAPAPPRWKIFANGFWIICQIFLLAAIAAIAFDRESFLELSASIHGADAPLMGSVFADLFVTDWFGWVTLALCIVTVAKERLILVFRHRLWINFGLVIPPAILMFAIITAMY